VIELASVPEAATKPALRHAGVYSARLVAWIPFLTSRATGLSGPPTGLFPAFRLASPRPAGTRLRAAARKTAEDTSFVGSLEANRRTCAKRLTTEARAFARLRGRAERPRLLAAFRDGKVFPKGAHFPENVILLNRMISKYLRKSMKGEKRCSESERFSNKFERHLRIERHEQTYRPLLSCLDRRSEH
jgi:hypothetical protein